MKTTVSFLLCFAICSAPTEEFTLSSNDCISPCIVEMKRIPKCASLVIGHNGLGEFTLWYAAPRMSSINWKLLLCQ